MLQNSSAAPIKEISDELYTCEFIMSTKMFDIVLFGKLCIIRYKFLMDVMLNTHLDDKHSPTWQKAYIHIQKKLAAGELRAGQAISELSLAKQLGISRTPIREALSRLAAEGIVERISNRRLAVVTFTRQDIVDLYELREALEGYAVGKAARQVVPQAEIHRLQRFAESILELKEELNHSGKSELDEEQMHQFVVKDLGFHTMLIRMARNARILKTVNETRLLIRIFSMQRHGHNQDLLGQIYLSHTAIVKAVADQDPELATRLISEHIQRSLQERLDDFDHWEVEASVRRSFPYFFGISPL
jgi:DNA-binding GntR family transcriptional regulator